MTLDFTHKKYIELLEALNNYKIITVAEYIKNPPSEPFVVLRHDVDRKPQNALKMAQIEKERKINATYYFRYNKEVFNKKIIEEIDQMGHEIGYHYETLSKADGDEREAKKLFQEELNEFRKNFDVKTVSMHGSPLSKLSNDEIWKKQNYQEYDLLGDGSLSISDIAYYTDAGRSWDNQNNLRDHLKTDSPKSKIIRTTDELTELARSRSTSKLYINIHSERWTANYFEWVISVSTDICFNLGKKILKIIRK